MKVLLILLFASCNFYGRKGGVGTNCPKTNNVVNGGDSSGDNRTCLPPTKGL